MKKSNKLYLFKNKFDKLGTAETVAAQGFRKDETLS